MHIMEWYLILLENKKMQSLGAQALGQSQSC